MIIIHFIATSLLYVVLWGLCELAHWKKRRELLDEIKILKDSDRKQRLENAALKDRVQTESQKIAELEKSEQMHLRVIEAARDHARKNREGNQEEIEFGDAPLPASLKQPIVVGQLVNEHFRATRAKEISVCYGGKLNLGDYNSVHIEATVTALLEDGDTVEAATAELFEDVKSAVRAQAQALKAKNPRASVLEIFAGLPVEAQQQINGGGK